MTTAPSSRRFRDTCQTLGIPQYHSRAKTPKDNATNERFNRTLEEEFIRLGDGTDNIDLFNRKLCRGSWSTTPPAAPEPRVPDTDVFHPAARQGDTEVVIHYIGLTFLRESACSIIPHLPCGRFRESEPSLDTAPRAACS
jgi:transposase InsO family protein